MSLWFLAAAGFLETVEGDVVHYAHIEARIEQLGERFDMRLRSTGGVPFKRPKTLKAWVSLSSPLGTANGWVGVRRAWGIGALRSL